MAEKRTNGKRNRSAGHDFERRVAEILRAVGFPYVVTSRSESKSRDDKGIDLMNKEEGVHGRLPYNIQCKNVKGSVNYARILESIPKEPGIVNVVFHKFTEKRGAGVNFHPRGHFAILDMHDFIEMIAFIQTKKSEQ